MNSYEDITNAFAPFYTTTLLSNSVTPSAIYDIEAQIDAYAVIDPDDIQSVNEILYMEKVTAADKKKINFRVPDSILTVRSGLLSLYRKSKTNIQNLILHQNL